MSFGGNVQEPYHIGDESITLTSQHRDLGILVDNHLKFSDHCSAVAAKAHRRAYIVRKCFTHSDAKTLVFAFKVYVRPILEYNSEIWSPYLLSDIKKLEKVQRKFTK